MALEIILMELRPFKLSPVRQFSCIVGHGVM